MSEEENRTEVSSETPEGSSEPVATETSATADEPAAAAAPATVPPKAESVPPKAESVPPKAESVAPKAASVPPKAVSVPPAAAASVAHGGHDAHGDHDGVGHVAPMWLLIGVAGALLFLTVATVAVTMVDLGSQWNFIIAMIIATVKAILVMGFFMHLIWDSRFNVIAFTSSFLFVILFLAMSVLDRSEFRPDVQRWENDQAQSAK